MIDIDEAVKNSMTFPTFHDAYLFNLRNVFENFQYMNSPRGHLSREIINVNLCIENPIERVCYSPSRKTNLIFNFAESFWHLFNYTSLDYISYYASKFKEYINHDNKLSGIAYGPKIFSFNGVINQIDNVVSTLGRIDPDSKRAFVSIFSPCEMIYGHDRDISCTIGFQFFLRNSRLIMVTFMRANDAYRGLVSDVFFFTLLQEILARQLKVSVGSYHHNVSSMHIYERDAIKVEQILGGDHICEYSALADLSFPTMPEINNWECIDKIKRFEEALRLGKYHLNNEDLLQASLPYYWEQVLLLLEVYREIKYQESVDPKWFNMLNRTYKFLVRNRWPELIKM